MQKLFYFLLLTIVFTATSCNKDDEPRKSLDYKSIVGQWELRENIQQPHTVIIDIQTEPKRILKVQHILKEGFKGEEIPDVEYEWISSPNGSGLLLEILNRPYGEDIGFYEIIDYCWISLPYPDFMVIHREHSISTELFYFDRLSN